MANPVVDSAIPLPKPDFKYEYWTQHFRERIQSGDLPDGARLPSQKDLREIHDLSQTTVEHVYQALENEGLIVREHRRGVFVKAPRRQRALDTIALVCDGFGEFDAHPYYAQLIGTAHRMAGNDDMRILLCKSDLVSDLEGVSGILHIAPHAGAIREYLKQLPSQVPVVSVLGSWPSVPAVVADEQGGVFSAVEYLLHAGHKRVAMLASKIYGPSTRIDAYRNRLLQSGIKPREEWVRIMAEHYPSIPFEELGYLTMKEWLQSGWEKLGCTALLCQNDDTAAGAMRALGEAGIKVPDDVSVIGFDGTQVASYLRPSLTTIEMPLEAMITRAWELLRAHAHPLPSERPSPEIVMLPTKLRVAQSTAPPIQI